MDCNTRKGEAVAEDFLRMLYREGRLTQSELSGRFRALQDLAAGKLQPTIWNLSEEMGRLETTARKR